jgi:hypothetical protein
LLRGRWQGSQRQRQDGKSSHEFHGNHLYV